MPNVTVRDLNPDDNFCMIFKLYVDTGRRIYRQIRLDDMAIMPLETPDSLRLSYFPESNDEDKMTGFVAESDGEIVAVIGVSTSNSSKNGYIQGGFQDGFEFILNELLDRCSEVVRQRGGSKLFRFTSTYPGQIRNADISFWERHGFVSDDYYYTLMRCELNDWIAPSDLDVSGVSVENEINFAETMDFLNAEYENLLSDEFERSYADKDLSKVLLKLVNGAGDVEGISYYQVINKRLDPHQLEAASVGFHFRLNVSKQEKRRFIQATLTSMKQIGISLAFGRFSSQSFDTIVQLAAEGFDYENISMVRLVRPVAVIS